jgi:hypothetical protein
MTYGARMGYHIPRKVNPVLEISQKYRLFELASVTAAFVAGV